MATAVENNQNDNMTASPARESGAVWPFALLIADRTIYSDTLTELIGVLIPGYADFAGDEEGDVLAFLARVDSASNIANDCQALVLASMTEAGEFSAEDSSETSLTTLLSPRGSGLIDGSEFNFHWDEEATLILLTTDFAPFTERQLIEGNVQYFDPSDERTYLQSLEAFGFVELFVNANI